jgi:surfeit locus 1 family protein
VSEHVRPRHEVHLQQVDSLQADVPWAHRSWARMALLSGLGLACVGFVVLGLWQLQRLTWKRDLIERVQARIQAPATPAPSPAQWPSIADGRDATRYEYMRVIVSGRYVPNADTRVKAVTKLGTGYWLLTPLQQPDGNVVLINRGFVPMHWQPEAATQTADRHERAGDDRGRHNRVSDPIRITGLLRLTEPGGAFLRTNAPADARWYSRDVHAIAAVYGLQRVAPYFIDAEAASGPASGAAPAHHPRTADVGDTGSAPSWPMAGLTVVQFRNHHLQYAVTWFVLALMTIAGIWWVLREDRRPTSAV